ncbi:MAG: hypothetical protein JO345_29620 [Streptosporangiaceae bacterium]|nr:hypothetical protein [Streptosporangiaceae bacterium]
MTAPLDVTTGGKDVARTVFRTADDLLKLLERYDMLSESLEAGLRELRAELTDTLCPYTVEQLDAEKRKLDERFPEFEHRYTRCGSIVTWSDRRRPGA